MLDLNYVAGLLDADGHIGIFKFKNKGYKNFRFDLRIIVTNTYRPVLEELKNQFGGTILNRQHHVGWTPCFNWQLSNRLAEKFLEQIFDKLIIKKDQAKVALDFQKLVWNTGTGRWKSEDEKLEQIEAKLILYRKISELKKYASSNFVPPATTKRIDTRLCEAIV